MRPFLLPKNALRMTVITQTKGAKKRKGLKIRIPYPPSWSSSPLLPMATPPQSRSNTQPSPSKQHHNNQHSGKEQVGSYTLNFDHQLGEGNNTQVILGEDVNGLPVAVKIFNKPHMSERAIKMVEQGILSSVYPSHFTLSSPSSLIPLRSSFNKPHMSERAISFSHVLRLFSSYRPEFIFRSPFFVLFLIPSFVHPLRSLIPSPTWN